MARTDERLVRLGDRIHQLRKSQRISQIELASIIGRSQSYVSSLENATVSDGKDAPITPPDDVLESLAQALRTDAAEFHAILGRTPPDIVNDDTVMQIARRIAAAPPAKREAVLTLLGPDDAPRRAPTRELEREPIVEEWDIAAQKGERNEADEAKVVAEIRRRRNQS
jgi:transcriptional regulator with XRE-family HTH domain